MDFEERLAAIKADGRARRARRVKRNGAIVGVTCGVLAVVAVSGPLSPGASSDAGDVVAARDVPDRCHNSTDPSCGEFRWEPPPTNRPATIDVRTTTEGLAVALDVDWEDPDAARATPHVCWGDAACEEPPPACTTSAGFGRWTAPTTEPGSGTFKALTHTYAAPGTYDVVVIVVTAAWPAQSCAPPAGDPYASTAVARLTINVE